MIYIKRRVLKSAAEQRKTLSRSKWRSAAAKVLAQEEEVIPKLVKSVMNLSKLSRKGDLIFSVGVLLCRKSDSKQGAFNVKTRFR